MHFHLGYSCSSFLFIEIAKVRIVLIFCLKFAIQVYNSSLFLLLVLPLESAIAWLVVVLQGKHWSLLLLTGSPIHIISIDFENLFLKPVDNFFFGKAL